MILSIQSGSEVFSKALTQVQLEAIASLLNALAGSLWSRLTPPEYCRYLQDRKKVLYNLPNSETISLTRQLKTTQWIHHLVLEMEQNVYSFQCQKFTNCEMGVKRLGNCHICRAVEDSTLTSFYQKSTLIEIFVVYNINSNETLMVNLKRQKPTAVSNIWGETLLYKASNSTALDYRIALQAEKEHNLLASSH
uniref:Uncharacterized protein n=1 Tax=Nelumbo nucifera TaxID=4432 RepID=A0A822Y4T2_NELNU|nr:TPA_asm: hypothetical protein HUJ06_028740 [Nelumbo nucifera]